MFKFPIIPGGAEKQPIFIEIRDDEDTCMWYDDDEKPSLISNDSGSGEPGMCSCLEQV
jgi:mitotic spindle assembly checkpoint protein MAD1